VALLSWIIKSEWEIEIQNKLPLDNKFFRLEHLMTSYKMLCEEDEMKYFYVIEAML